MSHPLGLNLMSTHSLGHQSSGFGFATSLSASQKHMVFTNCVAEDCSATLVEIADELGDPPFVLLHETNRRLTDCFFPRLLIHFLQGFSYWNEGHFMSFRRLAKLNLVIRRISFLVLFSTYLLRFAPLFSSSNRVPQAVLHKTK
ncbi:hypothetical protein H5410_030737 [Solanum commersonii]|uniref:Uncharacterized protein n=1 Tax=Solanum commersonii TaxID=4109 RepID=A0A9J5YHT3_SOLCO|nr:hypothetical protein H5410_030737 [Solanum commersonii]